MAHTAPYTDGDKLTLDVDIDDEVNYAADVRQWLIDSATDAASFELVTNGVTVMGQDVPQGERGGLLPVKLKVIGAQDGSQAFCTFRVTTGDDQQFDKTMWFKPVVN